MDPRTWPDGCERALHEAYDTALLDLDGVVYAGGEAIDHAVRVAGHRARRGHAAGVRHQQRAAHAARRSRST